MWASHALRVTVSVCGYRLVGQFIDCLFSQIASLIGLERDLDSLGTWTVVWPFVRPTLIIRTLHFLDLVKKISRNHIYGYQWQCFRITFMLYTMEKRKSKSLKSLIKKKRA